MANNVTRITANGNFYTAGFIDEVNSNSNSSVSKNLLPSSQNFTVGPWTNRLTLLSTTDLAPDGTNTATTWTYNRQFALVQNTNVSLTPGKTYTVSIYVKVDSLPGVPKIYPGQGLGTNIAINTTAAFANYFANLGLTNGVLTNFGPQTAVSAAQLAPNGFSRCSLTFTVYNNQITNSIGFWLGGFNGNDMTGYTMTIWGAQLEEGNVATDYVRTDTLGKPLATFKNKTTQVGNFYTAGFIDEISQNSIRTPKNLAYPSQDLSLWGLAQDFDKPIVVKTTDTTAPDGTYTAVKWTNLRPSTWNYTPYNNTIFKAGQQYCFSVYAKAGLSPINTNNSFVILLYATYFSNSSSPNVVGSYDLINLTATNSGGTNVDSVGIIPIGNGWYRCWMTATCRIANNNSGHQLIRYGGTNSFMYFWGYQIEEGSYPSDYVATSNTGSIITNFVKRDTSNGVSMVTGYFDEVNGVLNQVVDSSLIFNLDAAKTESYPGTGTVWYDTTPNKVNFNFYSPVLTTYYPSWNYSSNAFFSNFYNGNSAFYNSSPNTILDSSSFTIEIWSKQTVLNSNGSYWNQLAYRENYNVSGFRMGVNYTGNTLYPTFWTNQSGGNFSLQSPIGVNLGSWYQVVVTYDITIRMCSIYINGIFCGSQTGAIYNVPVGQTFSILAIGNGMFSANGYLGNFMYYNRPLTSSEISQNFNAIRGRYGI